MLSRVGVLLFMALALILGGCGDGKEPTPTATRAPSIAPAPTSTATATPAPTVTSAPIPTATSRPAPTPVPTGTLEVRVTDLPNPTITAIDITVESIEVHRATDGEWVKVVEGPVSFDLIAVAGIEEFLGSEELTPGKYTQIRLRITSTTITGDGEKLDANVPGDTLRIVRPFTINDGETTIATLDSGGPHH